MECRDLSGVPGQRGAKIDPFGVDLEQLFDVVCLNGLCQLVEQSILLYAVLNVLLLEVLFTDVFPAVLPESEWAGGWNGKEQ